jgi:ParB family chromosome partitioning protein
MTTVTEPITTIPPAAQCNGQHIPPWIVSCADEQAPHQFQSLAIAQIETTHTSAVAEDLSNLMSSIASVGLLHPVIVITNGTETYRLLAGRDRLEACKRLGWTSIPAHIVSFDAPEGTHTALLIELATIDENLIRRQMADLEFAGQLHRRKAIYEALYPHTKHGGNRKQHPTFGSPPAHIPAFIDDSASITGRSRSTVGEYLQIAKRLSSEVKTLLRDTPVADRKMDLLALAKMAPQAQQDIAHTIVSQGLATLQEVQQKAGIPIRGKTPKKKPSLFNGKGLMGFLEDVKDYAYKHIEHYEESGLLSHEMERRDDKIVLVLSLKHE